jgi:hypothetical protein
MRSYLEAIERKLDHSPSINNYFITHTKDCLENAASLRDLKVIWDRIHNT